MYSIYLGKSQLPNSECVSSTSLSVADRGDNAVKPVDHILSISSRVLPLVSGTKKYTKQKHPIPHNPKMKNNPEGDRAANSIGTVSATATFIT